MGTDFFEHHYADVGPVMLHYVAAGPADGEAVVLLHGWPETWFEWRHVIPGLAERYRVIAPDLRGLGDSGRPADGYDKRTVAADIWTLVGEQLGYKQFHLAGHDWGGPTAYALAAAHRDAVRKLAILDVTIPGDGLENMSQGGKRWHHMFHRTLDLPEALTAGREDIYLGWFYDDFSYRPVIGAAERAEYLRTYTRPGAMRAGFAYYRNIPVDAGHNAENRAAGKLAMPVLTISGDRGRGRGPESAESLRQMAVSVTEDIVPECGHFVPEEAPAHVRDRLLAFFGGG